MPSPATPKGQLGDAGASTSRLERKRSPRGDAPNVCRSPGFIDHRVEVFGFALERVPWVVAVFCAPPCSFVRAAQRAGCSAPFLGDRTRPRPRSMVALSRTRECDQGAVERCHGSPQSRCWRRLVALPIELGLCKSPIASPFLSRLFLPGWTGQPGETHRVGEIVSRVDREATRRRGCKQPRDVVVGVEVAPKARRLTRGWAGVDRRVAIHVTTAWSFLPDSASRKDQSRRTAGGWHWRRRIRPNR